MGKQGIRVTRLFVFLALFCALLGGTFASSSLVVEAATKKASISDKKLTIPVGKVDKKVYYGENPWYLSNGKQLTVKNKVKGATYTFKSSDTKVAKIDKDGGYVTGVKAGTTTITCTQTYNNKTTTVGKCKVTVKNASLTVSEYGNEFAAGKNAFGLYDYYSYMDPLFYIGYRNPDATYTVTSDSNDFVIKEVKIDASKAKGITNDEVFQQILKDFIGKRYFYGYEFSATKAGTYTVTVKETYNNKTKNLGSFKVVIKDTTIDEAEVELKLDNYLYVFNLISYPKALTSYYFNIEGYDETNPENNVLDLVQDGYLYIYGKKVGTAQVTIREGSEDGALIGTVTINVSEAHCEEIIVDELEYTTYIDDYFDIYYNLEPWDTTDKVTIVSDNPDVLKVEYDEEEDYYSYTPLKAGEANVTITCGDQSVVCKVVVEEW